MTIYTEFVHEEWWFSHQFFVCLPEAIIYPLVLYGGTPFFINQQVEREPKEPDFAQNQASPETKKSNPPKTAWWF